MIPKVSFVVPCYNLAHYLEECVKSILAQTFTQFEVLIMDDCSPDATRQVAESFEDPRIRYVRNDKNLGHLANYNKGIRLARGEYIWLISADDRIRNDNALARYVAVTETHARVAFAFCRGIELYEQSETKILKNYSYGVHDRIFDGHKLIPQLLSSGGILAAGVMVRKRCCEQMGLYPLTMPHQADMYLWSMIALEYDVAYFAEPMINYRRHAGSMMNTFMRNAPQLMINDELTVLWETKRRCQSLGLKRLAGKCDSLIGSRYARYISANLYGDLSNPWRMTTLECERSLTTFCRNVQELRSIKVAIDIAIADEHYSNKRYADALEGYLRARKKQPTHFAVYVKYLLLRSGSVGVFLRHWVGWLRQRTQDIWVCVG